MRLVRKTMTTAGLLMLALVPVATALASESATADVPIAVAQPLTSLTVGGFIPAGVVAGIRVVLPETVMLVAVGSALLGIAAVMRRTGTAA